jgi:F-type H+-transporting ATPase subunit b
MANNSGTVVRETTGHAKAFPPLDTSTFGPQLVWLAISFGLLYLLAKHVILPRVGGVIEERGGRIEYDLALADKLKTETKRAISSHELALADARARGNAVARSIQSEVSAEIARDLADAEADLAAKLADADRRISEAKAKALASVRDIASDVASAIATRLIGKEVSKSDVENALMRDAAQ